MDYLPFKVCLLKPLEAMSYLTPIGEMVAFRTVTLIPHYFAKRLAPNSIDDIYVVYAPPQNEVYKEWEIKEMKEACTTRGLKFQLHLPGVK